MTGSDGETDDLFGAGPPFVVTWGAIAAVCGPADPARLEPAKPPPNWFRSGPTPTTPAIPGVPPTPLQWLGILDDDRTFWVDPEEGAVEEFEYLMAGK